MMKAVDAFTRALQLNGGCVGALIGLGNFISETLRKISGNLTRRLSEGICDFIFLSIFLMHILQPKSSKMSRMSNQIRSSKKLRQRF